MLSILPKPARQGVTIILARPLKLKYIIGSLHGRKSAFLSPQPQEKTLSKWVQGATATGTLSDAQGFRRQMDGK